MYITFILAVSLCYSHSRCHMCTVADQRHWPLRDLIYAICALQISRLVLSSSVAASDLLHVYALSGSDSFDSH